MVGIKHCIANGLYSEWIAVRKLTNRTAIRNQIIAWPKFSIPQPKELQTLWNSYL